MNGRRGDMQRIDFCMNRQWNLADKLVRQQLDFFAVRQKWKARKELQAFLSGSRITSVAFVHDELGDAKLEQIPMAMPPFVRYLLIGRREQITTGP